MKEQQLEGAPLYLARGSHGPTGRCSSHHRGTLLLDALLAAPPASLQLTGEGPRCVPEAMQPTREPSLSIFPARLLIGSRKVDGLVWGGGAHMRVLPQSFNHIAL